MIVRKPWKMQGINREREGQRDIERQRHRDREGWRETDRDREGHRGIERGDSVPVCCFSSLMFSLSPFRALHVLLVSSSLEFDP